MLEFCGKPAYDTVSHRRGDIKLVASVGIWGPGRTLRLPPFVRRVMSWRATAFVKPLSTHPDGTKLTAREKLILFVLADSHNDEYDCAWLGFKKAAAAALTSR